MIQHVLTLPIPPSINALHRVKGKRQIKSFAYRQWEGDADKISMTQKPQGGWQTITGPFTAEVIIDTKHNGRADLDNRGSKALLDYCQRLGLIANDKYLQGIHVSLGTEPIGCRITLKESRL